MRQSAAIKKVVAVWTIICMMLPSFVFTVSAEKENISLANVVTEDSNLFLTALLCSMVQMEKFKH